MRQRIGEVAAIVDRLLLNKGVVCEAAATLAHSRTVPGQHQTIALRRPSFLGLPPLQLLGVCPPLARPSSARTGCRCWLLSQKGEGARTRRRGAVGNPEGGMSRFSFQHLARHTPWPASHRPAVGVEPRAQSGEISVLRNPFRVSPSKSPPYNGPVKDT